MAPLEDKQKIYGMGALVANIMLIAGIGLSAIYAALPLLGGKMSLRAVIAYATWVGIALAMKNALKRARMHMHLRARDFALLWLATMICLIIWLTYPMNILFGVLCTAGFILSYRGQNPPTE